MSGPINLADYSSLLLTKCKQKPVRFETENKPTRLLIYSLVDSEDTAVVKNGTLDIRCDE